MSLLGLLHECLPDFVLRCSVICRADGDFCESRFEGGCTKHKEMSLFSCKLHYNSSLFSPKTHTRTNTYGQVFVLKCCSSTGREYFRRIGSFVLNYFKDIFGVASRIRGQTTEERTFTLIRIRRFDNSI